MDSSVQPLIISIPFGGSSGESQSYKLKNDSSSSHLSLLINFRSRSARAIPPKAKYFF